jgi:hypothetical protein
MTGASASMMWPGIIRYSRGNRDRLQERDTAARFLACLAAGRVEVSVCAVRYASERITSNGKRRETGFNQSAPALIPIV